MYRRYCLIAILPMRGNMSVLRLSWRIEPVSRQTMRWGPLMSINASWLRMFIEMARRYGLPAGDTLALGVQDVMFDHETGAALLKERGMAVKTLAVDERTYALSRNQRQFTQNPKHYMGVKDLFKMMGHKSLDTLDAFEMDGPDLLWDLTKPIPKKWHNKYDLLFDIGVLEHTSDIFQALENAANLVKIGGWIVLYLPMVSPINTCMYHPNPPFYYDILAANGFHNMDGWINWMPDWDQQNDIRTIWLNFKYNDDVYIWQPRFYTVMLFVAQKREHIGEFHPVLQNFYKEWFAGEPLLSSGREACSLKQAGLSEHGAIASALSKRPAFVRALMGSFSDKPERVGVWSYPTVKSEPNPDQLTRFPPNDSGVPYAPSYIVLPVDSRLQADIPEQMVVGSPLREQLYL
jgi:hypothetical protein